MNLTREDQIKFAEAILPLIDASTTPEELEPLSTMTALVLRWAGTKDNGVIFDLCEYIYELHKIRLGQEDTGWMNSAKKSLMDQIDNTLRN